jgi:uncharacterized membrane protein YhaH (DUF805 family)
MKFINSILNTFYKVADFHSRSQKKELIYYMLFLIGLLLIAVVLDLSGIGLMFDFEGKSKAASYVISSLFLDIFIISLIPLICLSIRRLHDVNLSGVYIGVLIVVDLVLRFQGYTYAPVTKGVNLIIIFALIVLCFKNSYPRDNKYGKYVAPAKTKPKDIIRSDS